MSAVLESVSLSPVSAPRRHAPCLAAAGSLLVKTADSQAELEGALRLRHQIFSGELGARIGAQDGLDQDIFDPHCLHLIVVDTLVDRVVGTYRVLMPEQAKALGCLYIDGEFWLTRLAHLRDGLVELGRACVHPDYRSGATLMLLWAGLGALLSGSGLRQFIGCVSVSMSDGGYQAAGLYRALSQTHLADETLRVWPRRRLSVDTLPETTDIAIPPLMKGYLRAGARLLGEPHVDGEFGCADFPMMLDLESLGARHRRRFLQ